MKRHLVKISNTPVINRLYMHLYMRALVDFFLERRLVTYIDYGFEVDSYHAGFIILEIDLYTPAAKRVASKLNGIDLNLNDNSLKICIAQIAAAEKAHIGAKLEPVIEKLLQLHNRPWTNLDDLALVDFSSIKRDWRLLQYQKAPAKFFRTMHSDLYLDRSFAAKNSMLLPLFYIVTAALSENINGELEERFGYYLVNNASLVCSKSLVRKRVTFTAYTRVISNITEEIKFIRIFLEVMFANGFVDDLKDQLQSSNYKNRFLPNTVNVFEATSVLVGAAGWSQIITEKNIVKVLKHTTLQLTMGREKQILELKELL